jgi:peptide/nickel transport system permease protein
MSEPVVVAPSGSGAPANAAGAPGVPGWRRVIGERTVIVGSVILLGFVVMAVLAPVLAPYDPLSLHPPLAAPSRDFPLGTDPLGHDVLSFTIWGARVSLSFAIGAALISIVVGVLIGSIPTYIGGLTDDIASRFVELVLMIPSLFLIIAVVAVVGNDIVFVIAVVGLTIWPSNAKLMRAQVLTLKQRTYVSASVASGTRPLTTVLRHVVPNGMAPVIANTSLQMAYAVVLEAGLSFLGLSDPNHPSWGQLLNAAKTYLVTAPWLYIVPGTALVLLLLALYLIGDGVGRALDPRMKVR